jgi:glycosyltransferase involved in cell wall biosynthesis
MIRVLHLSAQPPDEQSLRLSELLTASAAPSAVVEGRRIGRGGTYRSIPEAVLRLRRDMRRFDLVHVWDATSLSAAGLLRARNVVASLSGKLPRLGRWETARSAHWVCSTPYQQKLAREQLGRSDRCSVIEPSVLATGRNALPREALRAKLGIAEEDRVLLAPGESTRQAGHATAVWITSMLHIIDGRYKLLIAGNGPYTVAARKRAAALNRPELLVVAADAGVSGPLTEAADVVLFSPTGESPVLPVVECMAAGLPVIATDHPTLRGFLIEGRGVLLADWKKPPAVARRVLELFERPGLLAETSAKACREAAARFSATLFIERYLGIYREAAAPVSRASLAGAA